MEKKINQADLEFVESTLLLARSARKGGGTLARKSGGEGRAATDAGNKIIEIQIRHLDAQLGTAERLEKQWRTIQLALGALAVLLVAFLVGKLLLSEPKLEDLVAGTGVIFSGGAAAWIQGRVAEVKESRDSTNAALDQLRKDLSS